MPLILTSTLASQVEEPFQMSVVDVFFDALPNNILVLFQQVGKPLLHFSGNFVAHMNELPEVGIVIGMIGYMPQCIGEPGAIPGGHLLRCGEFGIIDIDYVGIRSAEFLFPPQGFCVDFLCGVKGFPPAAARPITSSSQVVPAVFM